MSFSIFLEPYNQYSQMAKGNVDKLKLAESSYLLGGKWFEACEKVSERLLYFTERGKELHEEFMDSIQKTKETKS